MAYKYTNEYTLYTHYVYYYHSYISLTYTLSSMHDAYAIKTKSSRTETKFTFVHVNGNLTPY